MNEAERDQIRLVLADLLDRAKNDIATSQKALFHDHAAKGMLKSGATIKRSQRELEQRASKLVVDAVHEVKAVDMSLEAFAMIAEAMEQFHSLLAAEFDALIEIADGAADPEKGESAARRAALALMREGRGRVARQLELHRFTFSRPSRSSLSHLGLTARLPASGAVPPPQTPIRQEKGGRPPAEFWDDLWAHIAAELYGGKLFPKSQADIERAMAEWIEAKGHSAATSTIRARARRLWDRLSSEEEA